MARLPACSQHGPRSRVGLTSSMINWQIGPDELVA
jgi:hypothetical protein